MKMALARLGILPFESLIGALAVVSGFLGLIHAGGVGQDALSLLLPDWVLTFLQALYLLAGLLLIGGLGSGKGNVEGAGLLLIGTSVLVRTYALFVVVGPTDLVLTGLVFNLMVVAACAARLRTLIRGDVLLRMGGKR